MRGHRHTSRLRRAQLMCEGGGGRTVKFLLSERAVQCVEDAVRVLHRACARASIHMHKTSSLKGVPLQLEKCQYTLVSASNDSRALQDHPHP